MPGWPQQRLTLAERERKGHALRAEMFSPSFQTLLADYLAFLADPPRTTTRRSADRGPALSGCANSSSARWPRPSSIGRADRGITNIGALAQREHVDMICAFFADCHGRLMPGQLQDFLVAPRPVALYHLNDRGLAEWIGRRLPRLAAGRGRRFGITEKNRRRLPSSRTLKHMRDLLLLPYRC